MVWACMRTIISVCLVFCVRIFCELFQSMFNTAVIWEGKFYFACILVSGFFLKPFYSLEHSWDSEKGTFTTRVIVTASMAPSNGVCCCSFFIFPIIFFAVLTSLPPINSRNSDPGSHISSRPSSPPLPFVPSFLSLQDFIQPFIPFAYPRHALRAVDSFFSFLFLFFSARVKLIARRNFLPELEPKRLRSS